MAGAFGTLAVSWKVLSEALMQASPSAFRLMALSVRLPLTSSQSCPSEMAGQARPSAGFLFDTSTWFSARVAGPVVQEPVSSLLTSKLTAPAARLMLPVKCGVIVRPSTGLKVLSVAVLTSTDQVCASCTSPLTPTVNTVSPEPMSAEPSIVNPSAVDRVSVLPLFTVSTFGAMTASSSRVPVSDAAGLPPM